MTLSKIIKVAETPFVWNIGKDLIEFKGMATKEFYSSENGKPNYDKIYKHYGIEKGHGEKVIALKNISALNPESNDSFETGWVAFPDILAARNEIISKDSFYQLAALGITEIKEGYLLMGLRAPMPKVVNGNIERKVTERGKDNYAHGLYGCPPAGSVSFKDRYIDNDPIKDTLIEEFKEEIGNFEIESISPIGIFEAYKPGPTGIKFVGKIKTDATLKQIQEVNAQSNELYEELVLKGASKEQMINEFKEKNLPIDGWEHIVIDGIYANPESLLKRIETQPQAFSGIGAGTIELYAKYCLINPAQNH